MHENNTKKEFKQTPGASHLDSHYATPCQLIMGYTIRQKIDICLKAESNPQMTQADLANWAKIQYGSVKPPSQTTISRILSSKNDLIASKETELELIRRRKQLNPLLRRILTEWITQSLWENIPITVPIIQLTANSIWNRLSTTEKVGNGIFNQKWCNSFLKKLNINIVGEKSDISHNPRKYNLNKVWKLDDKVELKGYLAELISEEGYTPKDIFTVDEFQLFYSLPLDQIFDVSSIDKGLKQTSSSPENSLTIMLGCNMDGSEKLTPLIVGKSDTFDASKSYNLSMKAFSSSTGHQDLLMNKLTEVYQILYKSNSNKWITSSMFQDYLLALEHKMSSVTPNRKILIILDDSSSHRIINLKFNNIRLCYLKNNLKHKNPYNLSYSGVKFDYLPMSFGIVEEFKTLYRIQQYVDKINLQKLKSNIKVENKHPIDFNNLDYKESPQGMEILTEADYQIPVIQVIEWIKNAWDSITPQKIFFSWKRTNLISLQKQWEKSEDQYVVENMLDQISSFQPNSSYDSLMEVMNFLNVVIPWEIEELLGLVNERTKITFSYVSIEEIIGSCLLETFMKDNELTRLEDMFKDSASMTLNSLLEEATKLGNDYEAENDVLQVGENDVLQVGENDKEVDTAESGNYDKKHKLVENTWFPEKRRSLSYSPDTDHVFTEASADKVVLKSSFVSSTIVPDIEISNALRHVISIAKSSNALRLSSSTLEDLERNMARLQRKGSG